MPRLWLGADPHFHAAESRNEGVLLRLRDLETKSAPGDWLAWAGDMTDNGTAAEYEAVRRALLRWQGRVILAPGNHDAGTLGLFVWGGSRRRWGALARELCSPPVLELGGRMVVSVDSCLYTVLPHDLAQGEVGKRQRKLMADEWPQSAKDKGLRLTYLMHHWPDCKDPALALQDGAEVRRLVEQGNADLVAGHTHHEETIRTASGSVLRCLDDFRSASRASFLDC
jgi:predicted phosphodiesterase